MKFLKSLKSLFIVRPNIIDVIFFYGTPLLILIDFPSITLASVIITGWTASILLTIRECRADNKYQKVLNDFRKQEFTPRRYYASHGMTMSQYLGIDTTHGIIKITTCSEHLFKVMKLSDLTGYYCNKNSICFKFDDASFPVFELFVTNEARKRKFARRIDELLSGECSSQGQISTHFGP